ncbi:MAG: TPM domain-containing protein [Candidatus Azobacteroides sp.]|nr:TPM domain-containing protein [Candidatus Azobacteroides sp.]
MKIFIYSVLINGLFWFCLPLSAQNVYTISSVPNDHLKNAADYVTNPDGIISQAAEEKTNATIASIENVSTAEIAVVLLSSIGDEDIDDFATRLFTQWGIGKKNDNGLLFLLVYDKKEMVFRTGYGLEGVLPDVILSRVIRNDISPLIRNGDFDGGIIAGITKVCDYLKNPETIREIMHQKENEPLQGGQFLRVYLGISLIITVCFFFYLFSKFGSKITNYQKYLSLNKKKGAVIAFTVFFPILMILFVAVYFFVIKRLRTQPITCSQCGNKMVRITEQPALNAYLTPAQQTEESIRSIDYDVWHCEQCGHTEALAFDQTSRYMVCPYCQAKTFYLAQDRINKDASSFAQGQGEHIFSCMNCKKTQSVLYTIPRIIVSPPSRSSSWGGGSFGGGGGSWGGGRTGGGGARGGW